MQCIVKSGKKGMMPNQALVDSNTEIWFSTMVLQGVKLSYQTQKEFGQSSNKLTKCSFRQEERGYKLICTNKTEILTE